MKQPNIKGVQALDGRTLSIAWKDGSGHDVDLTDFLNRFAVFAPMRDDDAAFRAVTVGEWGWCLHWSDTMEIAADTLWRLALEQHAARFRAWRDEMGLTQDGAAKALGLSLRTVKYYEAGTHPIPKTVELAMVGYRLLARNAAA